MYDNRLLPKLAPFKFIYLLCLTFVFLIVLIFWKVIIHYTYIKNLNEIKCGCSYDWRQKIVQYGPIINIVISFILYYVYFVIVKNDMKLSKYNIIPLALYVIYISYVYKLIKNKCDCSKNWKRDFILFATIFLVVIQLLGIYMSFA